MFQLNCFDASTNFLVFGASSGGIYIFKEDPCEFKKLIPSKVSRNIIFFLLVLKKLYRKNKNGTQGIPNVLGRFTFCHKVKTAKMFKFLKFKVTKAIF